MVSAQQTYNGNGFSIHEIIEHRDFCRKDRPLNRDLYNAEQLAAAQMQASLAKKGLELVLTSPAFSRLFQHLSEAPSGQHLRPYDAYRAIALLFHEQQLQQTI